jgi:hypothetical protein
MDRGENRAEYLTLPSNGTTMRARLANSTLCDVAGFTRKLEASYRTMRGRWCASATEA